MVKVLECDKSLAQDLFRMIIVHDCQTQKIADFRGACAKELLLHAADNACNACAQKTTGRVCCPEIMDKCAVRLAIEGTYDEYI